MVAPDMHMRSPEVLRSKSVCLYVSLSVPATTDCRSDR
ncbi:hypothetical protein F750_4882 [Streptomyces sp. PAMC 26508]|nr:hypothetical protein F750_4882 [Streptomyces sp. PAMC 26508]